MVADVLAGVLAGDFTLVMTAICGAVGLASFMALCTLLVAAFLRVGAGERQEAQQGRLQGMQQGAQPEVTTLPGSTCARPSPTSLPHWTAVAPLPQTPAAAGPASRRQRLGTVNSDGERVSLYVSDQSARGLSMRGLMLLPGCGGGGGGHGGKLTDLSQLRETWVIVPRHWMN